MKSVLISIQPKWCEAIAAGEKTIEVRKTYPKIETPFKCYIYETNNTKGVHGFSVLGRYRMGKVIGEFICDKVATYPRNYEFGYEISENEFNETALTAEQFVDYGNGGTLYGWHISDLTIYDSPKELSEFKISCNRKNPCCSCCNRFTSKPWDICNSTITRPPQSWCYVEEL